MQPTALGRTIEFSPRRRAATISVRPAYAIGSRWPGMFCQGAEAIPQRRLSGIADFYQAFYPTRQRPSPALSRPRLTDCQASATLLIANALFQRACLPAFAIRQQLF